jgi:hypothetical protein
MLPPLALAVTPAPDELIEPASADAMLLGVVPLPFVQLPP